MRSPVLSPFTKRCMSLCDPSNSPCSRIDRKHDDLADQQSFEEAVWLRTSTTAVPTAVYKVLRAKYGLAKWPSHHLRSLDELVSCIRHLPDDSQGWGAWVSYSRVQLVADLRGEERLLLEADAGKFSLGYYKLKETLQKQGALPSKRTVLLKHPQVTTVQQAACLYYAGDSSLMLLSSCSWFSCWLFFCLQVS